MLNARIRHTFFDANPNELNFIGSTKTWNPESENENRIMETETETGYRIKYQ